MPRQWIFSGPWDLALVLSGLSLCIGLTLLHPFGWDVRVALGLFFADRALAFAHSWSTTYTVIGSKLFAPLRRESRDRFVRIPLVIFLLSLALGVLIAKTVNIADSGEVDWQSFLYYVPFVGLFFLGHFWHFGRQDFGVLSLYRQRMRQNTAKDRNRDQLYARVMMYVVQPVMYFYAFPKYPFSVLVHWLTGLQAYLQPLAASVLGLAALLFVAVEVSEWRKANRSYGKMIYYLIMLFHPLFLYCSTPTMFVYWHVAYLWSHWIVATALTARIHTRFQVAQGKTPRQAFIHHGRVVLAIVVISGLIVAPFGNSLLGMDFVDARETLRLLPPHRYLIYGLFFGFTLGEQLVHYYCDRCLFRFQDERVRALVGPFL